jgi:hypothetical protein
MGRQTEANVSAIAEGALAIDPADPSWQRIAGQFAAAHELLSASESRDRALQRLREALGLLVAEAHRVALTSTSTSFIRPSLQGTWADELALAARARQ